MLNDTFVEWFKALPSDAKRELCTNTDIDYRYLYNICGKTRRETPKYIVCMKLLEYSKVLNSKYGTRPLTPHDLDVNCNIKVPV